jgi:RHS repeat-associated protein
MTLAKDNTTQLTRYYIGGQYEADSETGVERLYLGGDAYSAAAVYVKEGGNRNIYYICRDYLGSITHIVNAAGSLTQELSYDPWGRLRDPNTLIAYTPDTEPVLFLSRGYTGHEHLTQFGLINMNARLYDAALGRFLSPDPYVQAPDFSQNFNRYSYCVNNPLIFVDCNGYTWISHFGYWVGQNWKPIVTIAATVVVVGVVTVATAGMGTLAAAAVVGAAGGFTGGAVGTWVNGGSFLQGVGSGLINGAIGAVAGMAGGAVAGWASKNIGGFALNSLQISGKSAIGGFISGAIGGAFSGAVGGFITGLALTGDLDKAWGMASQGAIYGGVAGLALGGYRGYKDAKALGRNPWTGKAVSTNNNISLNANKNISLHVTERMEERGVSLDAMQDALDNPIKMGEIKYDAIGRPSQVVIGREATVVINPTTGKITTTYPTSTQRLNAILNK